MIVKYVEDFVGLDGRFYESKVASDCCSVRLVPDCGGMMSAIFLYRDNDQSMIIPFSGKDLSQKMVYLDNNIFDIHVSSGVIDLSGFKAVKMSKYIELNSVMKTIGKSPLIAGKLPKDTPVDTRDISKDISHAVEFNDDSFKQLFKAIKEGL
nr:MAG TPA: hypothetical protein [Caudoviricetes sp.]